MESLIRKLVLLLVFVFILQTAKATYLTESAAWQGGLTRTSWTSLAWGDIDNDGDLDLAQIGCNSTTGGTNCNGYVAKIYVNNGSSLIENSTWEEELTPVHYGSIAWGDVDNDGDLDLALTGCNNSGGSVSACLDLGKSFIVFV